MADLLERRMALFIDFANLVKNTKKHAEEAGRQLVGPLSDPFTSLGGWFAGLPYSACGTGPPLGVAPGTWLLRDGWRRADPGS